MKYRLVKKTYLNGVILWVIQKKFLWWWEYVESSGEENKARTMLKQLLTGAPEQTVETIEQWNCPPRNKGT